ncbi:MAG: erythromycin esterase family protein [Bacteroidales bacterium]|nr:erythromycin esterase family protein [Bacteroidales bacterium]
MGRETRKLDTYNAQEGYGGTLEYFLNSLDIPFFILDLKTIKKENNALADWLLKEIPYRRIGAVSMGNNDFKVANVANDFDYLIFIKESSNSKLLKNLN